MLQVGIYVPLWASFLLQFVCDPSWQTPVYFPSWRLVQSCVSKCNKYHLKDHDKGIYINSLHFSKEPSKYCLYQI